MSLFEKALFYRYPEIPRIKPSARGHTLEWMILRDSGDVDQFAVCDQTFSSCVLQEKMDGCNVSLVIKPTGSRSLSIVVRSRNKRLFKMLANFTEESFEKGARTVMPRENETNGVEKETGSSSKPIIGFQTECNFDHICKIVSNVSRAKTYFQPPPFDIGNYETDFAYIGSMVYLALKEKILTEEKNTIIVFGEFTSAKVKRSLLYGSAQYTIFDVAVAAPNEGNERSDERGYYGFSFLPTTEWHDTLTFVGLETIHIVRKKINSFRALLEAVEAEPQKRYHKYRHIPLEGYVLKRDDSPLKATTPRCVKIKYSTEGLKGNAGPTYGSLFTIFDGDPAMTDSP